MAPSEDAFSMKDPFARKSVMESHFRSNQPPLMASKFVSFFSNEAARDAEAHGHPHVPNPTYFILVLEDCLPIGKVKDIINNQVPELEPVMEEQARLGQWGEGDEVKICRIRGAIKGWYNVLQDLLSDEGDVFFLKRVPLMYRNEAVEAYRPMEHFPRPKQQKRKSAETTPRSRSFVEGHESGRKSSLGKYLHWHRKSQATPRSHSVS